MIKELLILRFMICNCCC